MFLKYQAKNKYFNLQEYLDLCGYKKSQAMIICINADRNIGKTFDTWKTGDEKYMDDKLKVLYLRNSKSAIEKAKADFNNDYRGKYIMDTNNIYSVKPITMTKNKEPFTVYVKDKIVGYCCYMSGYKNAKSGMKDVEFVFYEEYNEKLKNIDLEKNSDIYANWINLITTAVRFENALIVLLGNRDEANNEFMVNWGIESRKEIDPNNNHRDELYIEHFSERGWFIDIPPSVYKHLENDQTIWHELAQFNNATKRYTHGEYLNDFSTNVVNYTKRIKETFTPIIGLMLAKEKFIYGTFERGYAIVRYDDDNFEQLNIKYLSMDAISNLDSKSLIMSKFENTELLIKLFKLIKYNKMYYSSFMIKNPFEFTIAMLDIELL